jgi:hypothetical protein
MNIITFSFGENWKNLNKILTEKDLTSALNDINYWIGEDEVKNKKVIDRFGLWNTFFKYV